MAIRFTGGHEGVDAFSGGSGFTAPVCVKTVKRDGYRIEKWESYPLPGSVVPYLVLIPNGVDSGHKVSAVLLYSRIWR